jgi:putative endonuclease
VRGQSLVTPAPSPRRSKAQKGETLAAWLLRCKGYRIEARNWRCPLGELDIIARHGCTLVFVEVKARSSRSAGLPEEAVDRRKQARIVRLARAYLAGLHGPTPPCRFDVVAVELDSFPPRVRHLEDAFSADLA